MPKRLFKISRWTSLDKKVIFFITMFVICLLSWIAYANAFNSVKLQNLRFEVRVLNHELSKNGGAYGSMGSTKDQSF